ncbi:hypothetical protein B0E53_03038 [Micromonospora sp. MH33]|nr:hypothetical protein B0E53_03038 [Micromonospora sp. MH33]
MRWPRQLASLLVVVLLLAGPPAVLLAVVGPPVRGWPTAAQVREWVQQPLTEQTLTAALTVGAWLIWLMLAYTVVLRVLVRLRTTSAWLRRLPLPTPLQATASGVAGAAVLGVTTNTAVAAPAHPAHPVAAGMTVSPDDIGPGESNGRIIAGGDGISVAGGWLPRDVAVEVSAAAALVWLRRRRDYQPGLSSNNQQAPDLAPLPRTVTSVQAALADSPPPPTAPSPYGVTALGEVLPTGGVSLVGPGALSAGRGLLVTALLARQRHPAASLITTKAALTALLGPATQSLTERLPAKIINNLDEAAQLVQRAKHRGRQTVAGQNQRTTIVSGLPTIVILDREDGDRDQLKHLADVSVATATILVVLGGWPGGPTWRVDSAGHLTDPYNTDASGSRLCVLDQVATTDLLTVLAPAEATTGSTAPDPPAPTRVQQKPRLPRQIPRHELRTPVAATHRRLHLRVLGDPQLHIDGKPFTVRRSAALQVLVYLAAVHPAGADTAQLTDAIWPGLPRHALTGRLYTALSDLRASIRAACGLHVIDHADDRYRLSPAHLDVDLWHLNAALRHAATAVTNDRAAWRAVIDSYPADLAEGRAWPWLDPIRETIRRHIIDVCAAFAAAESDPRQSLELLQAGIRIDPYNNAIQERASHLLRTLHEDAEPRTLHSDHIQ